MSQTNVTTYYCIEYTTPERESNSQTTDRRCLIHPATCDVTRAMAKKQQQNERIS